MDYAKELIEKEALEKEIEIYEGIGPAFEATVVKDIHEENV